MADQARQHISVLALSCRRPFYLRRAVAACADFESPLAHTRAALELGLALEATGEKGACDAYKRVLSRWGDAKPGSVTAEKARERAKALACVR